MEKRFALFISYIFSPLPVGLFLLFVLLLEEATSAPQFLRWFFFSIIFGLVPPALFFLWRLLGGKITDPFITKRRERILPYFLTLASTAFLSLLAYIFSLPYFVLVVALTVLANMLFQFLITLFWKISGHASVVTFAVLILIAIFGPPFFFTLILIPIVTWARLSLGAHSPNEIFAGIFLTGLLTTFIFILFL